MDFFGLLQHLFQGQPQAMSRQTRTPIYWQGTAPASYGEYDPMLRSIVLNQQRLPQDNPNMADLSSVLRHEQVHAMMPSATQNSILQYFWSNPQQAAAGTKELAAGGATGTSVKDLAREAPAYAVQGYSLGMPDSNVNEYANRMPPAIRQKYMQLLGGR